MIDPFSNLPPTVADLIRRGMADARLGRTASARRTFEQALTVDPQCGEALLWLAALAADGETSLRYLAQALAVNPHDPRAHAGIRWARKRVKPLSPAEQPTRPMARVILSGVTQPSPALVSRLAAEARPAPSSEAPESKVDDEPLWILPKWQWALTAMVAACIVLAGGVWLIDSLRGNRANAAGLPTVAVAQVTPTATPTDLPTFTATPTLSPLPTDTPLPSPSDTPVPTETPSPQPTATPYVPPPPTANIPPAGGDPSTRWVDVNLTTQTLVAYEGDTPVRSFLVSTGLWGTPTVTGRFSIYMRYDSQTMSGPGYYLPGVQWVQYFYQDYALHGTYWHNNFGHPMSHGCVNMTNADALWMYEWATYGTSVNIHY